MANVPRYFYFHPLSVKDDGLLQLFKMSIKAQVIAALAVILITWLIAVNPPPPTFQKYIETRKHRVMEIEGRENLYIFSIYTDDEEKTYLGIINSIIPL